MSNVEYQRPNGQNPDPELERVCEFLQTLATVQGVKPLEAVIDFSDRDPVDLAVKRFFDEEGGTYDRRTRLYLEPRMAERFMMNRSVEVDFLPRTSRAGKNSRHGVFFGDLGFDATDKLFPVAVKPYEEDHPARSSVREYLSNIGFSMQAIDCPKAVGVVLRHDKAYFLAELDETLTTLDSIDWSQFHGAMDENPGMREIWSHVARVTAVLHSMGSSAHFDFAPRNIAINADGSIRLIDLEDSRIDLTHPRDVEVRFGLSYRDLKLLVEAMCRPLRIPQVPGIAQNGITHRVGIGLFNQPERNWWDDFCYVYFDEYAEYRLAIARNGSHHSRLEADTRAELEVLEQVLKSDIAMHKQFVRYILLPAHT